MGSISLNSSLRSNLLSLQQTAKLQELTQNRLSTGLRVNSAIDNPSSYYTAAALNNRASDLSALLDAMSQGIQTLKAAQQGLQTASTFLEQAASIANQALETEPVPAKDWFEQQVGENGAVVSTAQELRDAVAANKETIVIYGKIDLGDISATNGISLKANQKLVGVGYYGNFDIETDKFSSISATSSVAKNLIYANQGGNEISDLSINYTNTSDTGTVYAVYTNGGGADKQYAYKLKDLDIVADFSNDNSRETPAILIDSFASANFEGNINIQTSGFGVYGIYSVNSSTTTINSDAKINIHTTGQRGYGIVNGNKSITNINSGANVNIQTNGKWGYGIYTASSSITTINSGANVNIQTSEQSGHGINTINSSTASILGNLSIKTNNSYGIINSNSSDNKTIIGSSAQIYLTNGTGKPIINHYDNGIAPNLLSIAAGAKIAIEKDGNAKWYQMQSDYGDRNASTSNSNQVTADNIAIVLDVAATSPWQLPKTIATVADEKIDKDAVQSYQNILTQFDALIKDSSYQGINLLQNNSLSINFNEDRSSKLEIKGIDASSEKLGIKTKEWGNKSDIAQSLAEIASALKQIRSYTQEFGNYYSIVTTREDFTEKLINVLTEGADKLTLADMNEESANSLMLETRQNLAINALSLASQAGQSILKLF